MRRLASPSVRVSVIASQGIPSRSLFTNSVSTGLVQVNEELPGFKAQYQKLLKKYGSSQENAELLKEAAKLKFVALEGARGSLSEKDFTQVTSGLDEIENAIASYVPQIQPTVDEPHDTKNHAFVTDPIGAEIFAKASALIDKQDYFLRLVREKLGLTPRRNAEILWEIVENSPADDFPAPPEPKAKGDLPAWLVSALEGTEFGKANSKKELNDLIVPPEARDLAPPLMKKAQKEGAPAVAAHIAAVEGITPGTPEYTTLETEVAGFDPTPGEYEKQAQQAVDATLNKLREYSGAIEQLYEQVSAEARATAAHYQGENGVARRAVRGFLLNNPEPNDEEKVKFMKTLREAIVQRRKFLGVSPHTLYPTLNLPRVITADKETMIKKFDLYAATL